jgi:hypothetical protein
VITISPDVIGGGGVGDTQSPVSGIPSHDIVAQFSVFSSNSYQGFTFHVKYIVALHQFAAKLIPVYNIYVVLPVNPVLK